MAFTPRTLPGITDVESLRRWVEEEFARLAGTLTEAIAVDLRPVYREPDKPRAGMIVCADGTSWNPGSGHGVYFYNLSGAWVKLG